MHFSLYYADCQSASTSFIVPDVIRYSPFVIPAFNAVFRQLSRLGDGLLCHLAYKVHIFLAYIRFFLYLCIQNKYSL